MNDVTNRALGSGSIDKTSAQGITRPFPVIRGFRAASRIACWIVSGTGLLLPWMGGVMAEVRRDPKALEVADSVERTIAPNGGWQKVGALRFTFLVKREDQVQGEVHHLWNVKTGQYRVQWKGGDGNERLVIFNVNTREGRGWMREAAKPAAGGASGQEPNAVVGEKPWTESSSEGLKKLLDTGYGRFINDTYWLLMPLKMKDPGVSLDAEPEKTVGGETYDVVRLTFDGVGLTPKDTYWVEVNRRTHLVDRWEYILQGDLEKAAAKAKAAQEKAAAEGGEEAKKPAETKPPTELKQPDKTVWLWKEWKTFGPLRLSTEKTIVGDDKVSILFNDVEVLAEAPPGGFDPPAK